MTLPTGIIVVTGAAGMIGSNILRALGARGCRLVGCDHVPRELRPAYTAGLTLEAWLSPSDLFRWLDAHEDEVGAIIHMGAISDTTETDRLRLQQENVDYAFDLWRCACLQRVPFLYASSAATYGGGEHGFADREDPAYLGALKPLNLYAQSKQQLDQLIVRDWRRHISPPLWAGFKFFNVFGPNEDHKGHMRSLVHKIAPTILRGETVQLFRSHRPDYPDGEQRRDFIHVADAVALVIRALEMSRLSGIFNVGTGRAHSFLDLVRATFAAFGIEPRIAFVDMPEAIRDQYQYHTQADIRKAVERGLQPATKPLDVAIADYVAALQAVGMGSRDVAA